MVLMAQLAKMEKARILERCEAGRVAARASLAEKGETHRGKASLGRPVCIDATAVAEWRKENEASIAKTAEHFGISAASVKRCKA